MGLYATTSTLDLLMAGINMTAGSEALSAASTYCDRAERRINASLARRYDLSTAYFQTTTSIPPILREWGAMLAEGYMWKGVSRGGAGKESIKRGESLIEEVMEDLKLLVGYELELVQTSGAIVPDMSNTSKRVLCNTTDYSTTFNEDDELSWSVDSDKLEDISDERD